MIDLSRRGFLLGAVTAAATTSFIAIPTPLLAYPFANKYATVVRLVKEVEDAMEAKVELWPTIRQSLAEVNKIRSPLSAAVASAEVALTEFILTAFPPMPDTNEGRWFQADALLSVWQKDRQFFDELTESDLQDVAEIAVPYVVFNYFDRKRSFINNGSGTFVLAMMNRYGDLWMTAAIKAQERAFFQKVGLR